MTINNCLARVSDAIGDSVSDELIILWLSEIENTVIKEIASTHISVSFDPAPITENCDREKVLFIPEPYSSIYIDYIIMKNDLRLRDIQRYMNSAAAFAASYTTFADWFNRTYMPLGCKSISL